MIGVIVPTIPTTATMAMIGGMKDDTNIGIVAIPAAIVVTTITATIGVTVMTTGVVDTGTATGAMTGGYADGSIDDRGAMARSIR